MATQQRIEFDETGITPVVGRVAFDETGLKPVRPVGAVESALRTVKESALTGLGLVDTLATGLASLFSEEEATRVAAMGNERQELIKQARPQADEEFNTAGQVVGAVASLPTEVLGGFGVQHGSQRAKELLARGSTMEEAQTAGNITGAVRAALNALPVKLGGKVGGAIESKIGSVLGGTATGAGIGAAGGVAARAVENAVLPEGKQYEDLRQENTPQAILADAALAGAFGAAGGIAGRARARKAAAEAPGPFPIDKMEDMGDGEYRAPNGSTVTKEAWELSSKKVRDGWMKEEPKLETPTEPKTPSPEDELKRLGEEHPSGPVADVVRQVTAERQKTAKVKGDAEELRRAAHSTTDPDLRAALLKRADKMDPPEKIPVGEAKEGAPEPYKGKEIPVGEAKEGIEVKTEIPKKGEIPAGEAKEVPEPYAGAKIPEGEATEVTRSGVQPEPDRVPAGESKELYIPPEKRNAADQVAKPEGSGQKRQDGNVPRQAPEAGAGDRTGRAAPGGGREAVPPTGKARPVEPAEAAPKKPDEPEEIFDLNLPKIDESMIVQAKREPVNAPAPSAKTRARGVEQARAALEKGKADGTLDSDGVDLALWVLDKNPNIARNLHIAVVDPRPDGMAKGSYVPADRIVKLVKNYTNADTAAHEITHHAERMMPIPVQRGIQKEWRRAYDKALREATGVQRDVLADVTKAIDGDTGAYKRIMDAFQGGILDRKKHYQLINPSEFWAVNAPRILSERFTGRGSWRAQALQWMREFVEKLKSTVGLRSDAPIIKALDTILNPKVTTGKSRAGRSMTVGERLDREQLDLVSTRTPPALAGRADPHLSKGLEVGLEAVNQAPAFKAKLADVMGSYVGMPRVRGSVDQRVEAYIQHMTDNLLWLYDQVPEKTRERSKMWYVGGREIVDRWTHQYNGRYSDAQMAASLALMSPKMPWDTNVSLSERIIDTWTNHQNTTWSPKMTAVADKIAAKNPNRIAEINLARGKKLSDVQHSNPKVARAAQAVWVRVYDEAHNNRAFRLLTPEGGFTKEYAKVKKGKDAVAAYGNGFGPIAKVIDVLENGSIQNISLHLGVAHKVRNFYNNLFDPTDPRSVTVDTHAVAAAHLRPLGQSAREVENSMGGAGSHAGTGQSGSYPLYAEAYRRAAAARGVLPREMQSITWEATRGLFDPAFKSAHAKDPALFDRIWREYSRNKADIYDTRERTLAAAGGITEPRWVRHDPGLNEGAWASSYKADLLGSERYPGAPGPRAGVRATEAVPEEPRTGVLKEPEEQLSIGGPTKRALPEETKAEFWERQLFDRFNRVTKLQVTAAPKSEAADIVGADVLFQGRAQHRGDVLERDFIKPLGKQLKAAKKAKLTVQDADDYLMAQHAFERNREIAKINPKFPDGGSGLTNKQAQDIINGFTPEQKVHLDKIAGTIYALNKKKLDDLVADGLIKPEVRDALNAKYKKYVPLKTLDQEDIFTGVGQGYSMRSNDIVEALGRGSKAGSPIAASIMDASRGIIRGEKALVDQAIWKYAEDSAVKDFIAPYEALKQRGNVWVNEQGQVKQPPKEVLIPQKDKTTGQVKMVIDPKLVKDYTIDLVINGEQKKVFVPDQLLRDQIKKLATTNDPGQWLSVIGRGTGAIGRMLTEYNPAFTIPNAVRDAITIGIRARGAGIDTGATLAGIPKAWATITKYKRDPNSPAAKEYKEFLEQGAKVGAYGIQDVTDTMKRLQRAGAELGYTGHKNTALRMTKNALKDVAHIISMGNEIMEYAGRFSAYQQAKAAGKTPREAAKLAKEITVNFNRSGEQGRRMNALLVFANAALQGLRNSVVYAKSPIVRRNMLGLVALGAGTQMYNELVGGFNEETNEPNVNSQNDAVADKNIELMVPGAKSQLNIPGLPERSGFKIPLPPEYAWLFAMGRRMYRAMSQGTWSKDAAGILGNVVDALLPARLPDADSGALAAAKAITPTLAAPYVDIWTNQNYFGQPIVPQQYDKKSPPPSYMVSRATTSDIAKAMSQFANVATGGDKVKPGYSEKVLGPLISPEGIEHLVGFYTGGLGQLAMQSKNLAKSAVEGKPIDINKLPIVNRFIFAEPKSYTSRRYQELASDFEYMRDYQKTGDTSKVDPKIKRAYPVYVAADKELDVLFKRLRTAKASGQDPEAIQEQIKKTQSRVIRAYNGQPVQ